MGVGGFGVVTSVKCLFSLFRCPLSCMRDFYSPIHAFTQTNVNAHFFIFHLSFSHVLGFS